MSEATGRQKMEQRLIQRSREDVSFSQRLMEDPKGAVEQELGTRLPEGVEVRTVEEPPTPSTWCSPASPR